MNRVEPGNEREDPPMDRGVYERLALIKFMSRIVDGQASKAEPLSLLTILTYHDLVEWLAYLCCQKLQITPDGDFSKCLKQINKELKQDGGALLFINEMESLNKARVQLKHYGTLPHRSLVEDMRRAVPQFLATNCQRVLGISFDEVSLSDLVTFQTAKERLKAAEACCTSGELKKGFEAVALAYYELLSEYESGQRDMFGHNPFRFGGNPRVLGRLESQIRGSGPYKIGSTRNEAASLAREAGRYLEEAISSLQGATRVLALGIDYRRYMRFMALTPIVHPMMNGGVQTTPRSGRHQPEPGLPELKYCVDFVIEAALALQGAAEMVETPSS